MPPEGGAKDIIPPKIISTDPENKSLNFHGSDIRIEFDEIVSIPELTSQLVVSPLLKNPPEIKARKNTLYISLKDTLRENTTYTMNFGSGIADNNEGNKLEDYQFVFSTGNILDTLSINGKVEKAFDKTTEKGILVSLYQTDGDSIPFLERPLYFTKTNDAGNFSITNISPGSYRIFALNDKDATYLYSTDEMIAYNNSSLQSNDTGITLRLFSEAPKLIFLKSYSAFPGKASLIFNGPADTIKLNWITDTTKLQIHAKTYSEHFDTITFWYKNITADSISLSLENLPGKDTVIFRLFKKSEAKAGRKIESSEFVVSTASNQSSVQHLHLPYYLLASRPVASADFSKIVFMEDSQVVKPEIIFTDSIHQNIAVFYKWKDRKSYILFYPPNTFTDIFGESNDTTRISFYSHSESDYGSITVKVRNLELEQYIIQLVSLDGLKVYRQSIFVKDTSIEMLNLDPGEYRIKFIRDKNANAKWDTGNYLNKVQPETTSFYGEKIQVRGNWDVELQIILPLTPQSK